MKPIIFLENIAKVTVPPTITTKCETYAKDRIKQDAKWYEDNRGGKNQFDPFNFWGYKCSEFAVSQFLTDHYGFPQMEPDTKLYGRTEKSWNADLIYKDIDFLGEKFDTLNIHVKSANRKTMQDGYPESFTFQLANKNNKGGMDAILTSTNANDICVFVYVPHTTVVTTKADFYIRAIVPWLHIRENNLLEQPVASSLRGVKICVYTESLRKSLLKMAG
jgi:hypothetical protein